MECGWEIGTFSVVGSSVHCHDSSCIAYGCGRVCRLIWTPQQQAVVNKPLTASMRQFFLSPRTLIFTSTTTPTTPSWSAVLQQGLVFFSTDGLYYVINGSIYTLSRYGAESFSLRSAVWIFVVSIPWYLRILSHICSLRAPSPRIYNHFRFYTGCSNLFHHVW